MTRLLFLARESVLDAVRYRLTGWIPLPQKTEGDEEHLAATVDWLEEACHHGRGGVISHYRPVPGRWLAPFPETTGYIIPTLFDHAAFSGEERFRERALQLTDWLVSVQLPDGGCMQGNFSGHARTGGIVFNTGQNLLGFLRAYGESGNAAYLEAARRAGRFLVDSAGEDGVWNRHLLRGLKHTINTRSAWALMLLDRETPDAAFRRVAAANLAWTLAQQQDNGWFRHGSSRPGGWPNTHFLAYTCEGLLEAYRLSGEATYRAAAEKTALRMLRLFETRGRLTAYWDDRWRPAGKFIGGRRHDMLCLTGCVQIARVWMQLFEENKDIRFLNSAFRMIDYIKTLQDVDTPDRRIRGAVKGSFPLYGSYSPLKYPNWAAKFLADALLLKIALREKVHAPRARAHETADA